MKLLKQFKIVAITFLILLSFACNNDSTNNENSRISVKLMDDPGDYDNVFIEVIDVMVKMDEESEEESEEESSWQSLEAINTGVYDLLDLTGGINVLLVDDFQIPSGELNQLRLVLGENNTIVIDGETFDLKTPSAQQSGLKINVNQILEPNISYTFLLDFMVDESIVMAGNSDNIILKPVIRATAEANSGAIAGHVLPAGTIIEASIMMGTEVVSSFADENGNFILVGLQAGTYDVVLTPDAQSGLPTVTVENVEVTIGNTTTLDAVTLE
ncbi:MAG: DUF4382 domain-containing protein [Bacteroidia bacterium]|nr:DUF4382 domain-containing protein [Bacteroidia bacterium]